VGKHPSSRNAGGWPEARGRAARAFSIASGVGLWMALTSLATGTTILHDFAPPVPTHPLAGLVRNSEGDLFGTTCQGGAFGAGTVFRISADGTESEVLHSFSGVDGSSPEASLVLDSEGNLFGTTSGGGASGRGTIFTLKADGTLFTVLHSFSGGAWDGERPWSALILDGAGDLFGTTTDGGASNLGTVFTIRTDGTNFGLLHSFAGVDGSSPLASLVLDSEDNLFGTTLGGGSSGRGTIFTLKTDGWEFELLHSFAGGPLDGEGPEAGLVLDGGGSLYGTTRFGGPIDGGVVFRVGRDGGGYALLHGFSGEPVDGSIPTAALVLDGSGSLYGTTEQGGSLNRGAVFGMRTDGSDYAVLHEFVGAPSDGAVPRAPLLHDGAGNLYGTTYQGGEGDDGTVFGLRTDGTDFVLLHGFGSDALNGRYPVSSLISDSAGNLYGTTEFGGVANRGTVFSMKADGTGFAVLHGFAGGTADGNGPQAPLVYDGAGNLYGTTVSGGGFSHGTVFTLRTDGTGFRLLHAFEAFPSQDGGVPMASLIRDSLGDLYGTTSEGGASNQGTVFRLKGDGTGYATLHSFAGGTLDGSAPHASLVLDGAGNLCGTTAFGGSFNLGTLFTMRGDGTGYAVLHSFQGGGSEGSYPGVALVGDGADNLYGTTASGGAVDLGTVFTIKTNGSGFGLLHSFGGGPSDAGRPFASLILDDMGNLYGTTYSAGASDLGTVYTIRTDGTGFALLHGFSGSPHDGSRPQAPLLRRGNALCGTTREGGVGGGGTVFALVNPLWKGADTPGIYRESDRQWYLKNTNAGGAADLEFPYGDPSDLAVKGDWDGDGDDSVGIYRDGTFFLRNSNTAGPGEIVFPFGAVGDIPIAGDWDGDGIDTVGVYRPATAEWFLRNTNAAGAPDLSFTYGLANETPVVGDWDGDGIDTVGIFRASDRQWYLHNSNAGGNAELVFPYGDPAQDVPVVGDWDGDGDDTVGIYRAALGEWFLKNTNEAGFADLNFVYGLVNEKPLAGDWDGL
jgi:uncharacterized repeat protein (TIGR03803 family)